MGRDGKDDDDKKERGGKKKGKCRAFDICKALENDEEGVGKAGDMIGRTNCPHGIKNSDKKCLAQKCDEDGEGEEADIVCNFADLKKWSVTVAESMCKDNWSEKRIAKCEAKEEPEEEGAVAFDQN